MFKIQNFLNRTRYFFNKIQIPKNKPRYQSSFRPSFTRFIILLPSTCMFSINLLSKQQIKFETRNSIEPRLEKIAEKKDLEELLVRIATEIKEENFEDARTYTEEGLQISEQNNFNELLPYFYDALIIITLREGNDTVAEEILVRSIEKLTEIGYKDTDNEIVRFQLMLARLYQKKGNSDMAGLGFRNCISIQETKHNTVMDETSTSLYVNVLFWYSIFLNEENELTDSKNYMTKALELSKSTQTEPAQTLVILYNLAELSFRLKVNFLILIENLVKIIDFIRNSMMLSNI